MDCSVTIQTPQASSDCIKVCHKAFSLLLIVNVNNQATNNLICHFYLTDKDLYAAVAAPEHQPVDLAKRIVSFMRAYVRIADSDLVETELLRCLQRITLSPNKNASITA